MTKKLKVAKPTTVEGCADGIGCYHRIRAVARANEYTATTNEWHDVVRLPDGKWYVYNRVPVEYRMQAILARIDAKTDPS